MRTTVDTVHCSCGGTFDRFDQEVRYNGATSSGEPIEDFEVVPGGRCTSCQQAAYQVPVLLRLEIVHRSIDRQPGAPSAG